MMMTRLHKAIGDMLFLKMYKRDGFLKTYSSVSQEVTITLLAMDSGKRWQSTSYGSCRWLLCRASSFGMGNWRGTINSVHLAFVPFLIFVRGMHEENIEAASKLLNVFIFYK